MKNKIRLFKIYGQLECGDIGVADIDYQETVYSSPPLSIQYSTLVPNTIIDFVH